MAREIQAEKHPLGQLLANALHSAVREIARTDVRTSGGMMTSEAVQQRLAAASSAAVLDKRRLERTLDSKLKSETRALRDELVTMLDARLPSSYTLGLRRLVMRIARDVCAAGGAGEEILEEATGTCTIAAADLPPNLDADRLARR